MFSYQVGLLELSIGELGPSIVEVDTWLGYLVGGVFELEVFDDALLIDLVAELSPVDMIRLVLAFELSGQQVEFLVGQLQLGHHEPLSQLVDSQGA